ncbi:nitroreductase/quinone reductase family protein [Mycobacterium sp. OTB74]|uniref:nitroreductase/quinone reductase family protein n=1 Tax=Mycobacterium sp. OTB74 TaxID=1853452 RepID=UPI002476B2B9|nr:nitroreductase/quinone reductase family protein [Mycobacterium sp. OTB74]
MSDAGPERWQRPLNKFIIGLHQLGLRLGPVVVLTVPGRVSGRPTRTPITPFRLDGNLYAIEGYPATDWARNARAAGAGILTRGRRTRQVNIVSLSQQEARPVMRAWPTKVAVAASLSKKAGLVRDGRPEEFEALAGRLSAFRLEPIEG